jgi:hypothetical protein
MKGKKQKKHLHKQREELKIDCHLELKEVFLSCNEAFHCTG